MTSQMHWLDRAHPPAFSVFDPPLMVHETWTIQLTKESEISWPLHRNIMKTASILRLHVGLRNHLSPPVWKKWRTYLHKCIHPSTQNNWHMLKHYYKNAVCPFMACKLQRRKIDDAYRINLKRCFGKKISFFIKFKSKPTQAQQKLKVFVLDWYFFFERCETINLTQRRVEVTEVTEVHHIWDNWWNYIHCFEWCPFHHSRLVYVPELSVMNGCNGRNCWFGLLSSNR